MTDLFKILTILITTIQISCGSSIAPHDAAQTRLLDTASSPSSCDETSEFEQSGSYREAIDQKVAKLSFRYCLPFDPAEKARILTLQASGFPEIAQGESTELAQAVKALEYGYIEVLMGSVTIKIGQKHDDIVRLQQSFGLDWSGSYFADRRMTVEDSNRDIRTHYLRVDQDPPLVGPCPQAAQIPFQQEFVSTEGNRFKILEEGCRANAIVSQTPVYITRLLIEEQGLSPKEFIGHQNLIYQGTHHNDMDTISVDVGDQKLEIYVGRWGEPSIKKINKSDKSETVLPLRRLRSDF